MLSRVRLEKGKDAQIRDPRGTGAEIAMEQLSCVSEQLQRCDGQEDWEVYSGELKGIIDLHSFLKRVSRVEDHRMVAWERSRGCCTPSATVDAETMRLCLLAAILAVSVALICKQTSLVRKMLLGRCIEKAACDRSPIWEIW